MQTEKTLDDIVLLACEQYQKIKNMKVIFNNLYYSWGQYHYTKGEFNTVLGTRIRNRRDTFAEMEEHAEVQKRNAEPSQFQLAEPIYYQDPKTLEWRSY